MTEQERMALHQLKGIIQGHFTINEVTVKVARDALSEEGSRYMGGYTDASIHVASRAVEQNQATLDALDKILKGDLDV